MIMSFVRYIRQRLTWLAHCFKALFRRYHKQIKPLSSDLLKSDDVVFDVGAQVGQFSRIFALSAPEGRILAIEPAAYPLSILKIVKRVHSLDTMDIISQGVGEDSGQATLQTPMKKSGVVRYGLSSILTSDKNAADSASQQTIIVTTIDELSEKYAEGRNLALIKSRY